MHADHAFDAFCTVADLDSPKTSLEPQSATSSAGKSFSTQLLDVQKEELLSLHRIVNGCGAYAHPRFSRMRTMRQEFAFHHALAERAVEKAKAEFFSAIEREVQSVVEASVGDVRGAYELRLAEVGRRLEILHDTLE